MASAGACRSIPVLAGWHYWAERPAQAEAEEATASAMPSHLEPTEVVLGQSEGRMEACVSAGAGKTPQPIPVETEINQLL